MAKTFYDVLQVTPTADTEIIKAAYNSLMQRFYPESSLHDPNDDFLKTLNRAYEILSDPATRAGYDAALATSEIIEKAPIPKLAPTNPEQATTCLQPQQKATAERLVASFEHFSLYESYLLIGDKKQLLADAVNVECYARELSFNFIKSLESGFFVEFQGNASYGASHDSTWPFKKQRYDQVRQFGARLQAATGQSRMANTIKTLRGQGKILIGSGGKKEPQVYLTVKGELVTAVREFNIKSCAATGTFGVGVYSINNYQSPNTVLISNGKKPLLGYGKESLSFDLTGNADVLRGLLLWFANPKNVLQV